ncbi:MAG TPA: tRNA uridine-5-carboxymethylaminomethyl(34) synthesis GTPase MnmE [Nitrolancea sp.]|jgi:tRNA modification GTPase|nr:tRNA uridine-5-carboxymethylaminomethyl(34) synthesis GTPase MnmE [Nitrolancea sp.]
MYDDTIAAIATPPGDGGIAIVRLSGARAACITSAIFRRGERGHWVDVARLDSHRLYYGHVIDAITAGTIDEVMLVRMAAPHSYTREEVVEIQCHGGPIPARRILELTIAGGARLANAGEFTLRAFLNGRIDLSQAEAVMAVVSSRTSESLELAIQELRGSLTNRLGPARSELIQTLAYLDASADFPEDEIQGVDVATSLQRAACELQDVLAASNLGQLYHEGIQIAIVGRPNVGKSSLMNALLRSERAIVTPIAGTTRDVITESINLHGIPATLLDTAGIAETKDVIEQMGIDRSRRAIQSAALALFVIDGSQPSAPDDIAVARMLAERFDRDGAGRIVLVINKRDLPGQAEHDTILRSLAGCPVAKISTVTGQGLEALEETLFGLASSLAGEASEPATTSLRQREAVRAALESVEAGIAALLDDMPNDLIAVDVRDALMSIGEITGEQVSERVLDEIFSRFCIGK